MLNKVLMKQNDDPRFIFEQISTIENRYTTAIQQIEKEDLIAVILNAAAKDYQAVLTCKQCVRGIHVMLLNLETAMNQHYRQIKGSKPINKNDKEILLSAFGGVCYKCKQPAGHNKVHECPKKSGNKGNYQHGKQGKFLKKCTNCGCTGHKESNWWEKVKNQGKRPKWFKDKGKGEVEAKATDSGSKVEFMLCGMNKFSFPQNQDILMDPNIGITDLAAMVHTTAHKQGSIV
jgi:hypothetical protein